MGLDMYLEGHKYLFTDWEHSENNPTEDGFKVKERILELGYWRKHPNLHGYIVETFADGIDECQEICLDEKALRKILKAVEADNLPTTTGFFFGKSEPEDKEPTIKIIKGAIKWLKAESPEDKIFKSVIYRASW